MSLSSVRIKVCGITRMSDALEAVAYGVDALGFVFYEKSPRYIPLKEALPILSALPPFVTPVALFVNATEDEVKRVIKAIPTVLLQFHGDESPEYCDSFKQPYLKALRAQPGVNLLEQAKRYPLAQGIIFDSWSDTAFGGTGERFDLQRVKGRISQQAMIIAGGLTAENVKEVIHTVLPFAVDVSSGVEVSPGIKSADKIKHFVAAVNQAMTTD